MEDIVDYQESEPYLEAMQYIERMKQEKERSLESESVPMDHGVSLYPVTVPCTPLSHATVQWDSPEMPAEPPGLSEVGPRFDWTLDLPSAYQDATVDFSPEAESQADIMLASSQVCQ